MFAIATNNSQGELVFYGPFNTHEAAVSYGEKHMIGMFTVVKLHDSGAAMEWE